MKQLFNIDLGKVPSSSKKEALDRKKNLEKFFKNGLPNKKNENWKFTDLNFILNKNFKNVSNYHELHFDKKVELINDFDHNHIKTNTKKILQTFPQISPKLAKNLPKTFQKTRQKFAYSINRLFENILDFWDFEW